MMGESSATVRYVTGPTILLYSGEYFDFLEPERSQFTIEDVAHALAMICRFAGHCERFYSVAEHSVLASYQVAPQFALQALMHDAAEAFVGDVAKPLKALLPEYRAIEQRVEAAVMSRFGIRLPLAPEIKKIDVVMLATEQRHLMRNRDDWEYTRGEIPLDIYLPCWRPTVAKVKFLERFYELEDRD